MSESNTIRMLIGNYEKRFPEFSNSRPNLYPTPVVKYVFPYSITRVIGNIAVNWASIRFMEKWYVDQMVPILQIKFSN